MSETTTSKPMINSHNNLTFTERTGRLVLITTILGILGIGYFKVLIFTLKNLTDKIYLPFYISYEHIISACMLSTGFLILINAVWYCYCELFALNYTNRDESSDHEALRIIYRADFAYGALFKLSSLFFTLSLLMVILFSALFEFLVLNYLVISITLIPVCIFLVALVFKKFRQEVQKGLKLLKVFFVSKWGRFLVWVMTTFIFLLLLLTAMSSTQKTMFTAEFTNESTVPIKLHFENSIPEKVTLKFFSVDEGGNDHLYKELEIQKAQFRRSFIEVTEQPETAGKMSFTTILNNEMKKGSKAYVSGKSHYDYNYEINSRDYLIQGKNFVVIQFIIDSPQNKEYFKIVNQIDIDDKGSLFINKDEFQEKLKR